MKLTVAGILKLTTATVPSIAVLFGTTSVALAAEFPTLYLQVGAGANFLEGTNFSNEAGTFTTASKLNFDAGPVVTGAIGYAFGNGWRGEFEFGYRDSPAKDITLSSGAVVGGSLDFKAHVNAYSYMANAIYDFDLTRWMGPGYARWSPHVGGGIGAVNLQPNRAPATTVFGGQAIGGVEYALTPALRLGLDYRFIGTTSADFTFTQEAVTVGRAASANYYDHSILFTLRWKFGGAL